MILCETAEKTVRTLHWPISEGASARLRSSHRPASVRMTLRWRERVVLFEGFHQARLVCVGWKFGDPWEGWAFSDTRSGWLRLVEPRHLRHDVAGDNEIDGLPFTRKSEGCATTDDIRREASKR
jgi:hypothetical protein